MAGFWRRLFGGQEKQSQATQRPVAPKMASAPKHVKGIDTPLKLDHQARAEVLSQFRNGADPEQIPPGAWQDFWAHKLGVPFRQASRALFAEGLLCEASPEAKLEASHNLVELKALARKLKLKVSGRKDELAARLVNSGDLELLAQIEKLTVWTCSDEAQKIVEAHREGKKNRLHQTRLETLQLLRDKKLKEACEVVCRYEQAQFFPRGIGVDWVTADKAMLQSLKSLFGAQPKFHKRRFGAVSSELRERAAMSILWGTSDLGTIFPRAEAVEQAELFTRMLQCHASYLRDMKQLRKLASDGMAVQCEIIGTDDQNTTCAACLNDNGKAYALGEVPELPHEYCECAIGCRCTVAASLADGF